ncbi:unnamed protein product [Staurois parvus]|uniref:Uncharacterized protein n=1 Tax=Staurois parvus TaxID=386267 RepID=A0ABN9FMY4_9NEOB|nr:unnamed protein product [Staurois parvus]
MLMFKHLLQTYWKKSAFLFLALCLNQGGLTIWKLGHCPRAQGQ